ncbi:Uncharacterised protein [Edwardsiella hoshinae]|uniref:Uncharacterized protein n=1 Tax=Edwardsiella hoshinae TaxID=93378 RepID=A0A376J1U2_9GAMM|nr:Uncharacterised protein [Edwardsiella hoshinae]STE53284.1 Uncharacterised protein [Edwardsiella hoshinae]
MCCNPGSFSGCSYAQFLEMLVVQDFLRSFPIG